MNLITEAHNLLLKRREFVASFTHVGAPSRVQISKLVADHFKTGEDSVAIKHIRNKTGTSQFIVDAFVYDSPEQRTKIEPKPKQKKAAAS